jgi:diguanylate cyclase (GGDEF)-like protein
LIIATTNQMAARGQVMSGAYYSELVRIGSDNIRTLAHARADTLIAAHEISKIPLDAHAADDIAREAVEYCETQGRYLVKDIQERANRAGVERVGEAFAASIATEVSGVAAEIRRKLSKKVYEASVAGPPAAAPEEFDDLLPIFPKRRFNPELLSLVANASQTKPLTLLVIDFDHFKSVNDNFGHSVGDEVLVATSSMIKSVCQGKGLCYRWGGDEFAILLANHTVREGKAIADRIREAVAKVECPSYPKTVTLSIGIASFPGSCASGDQLFDAADHAAKEAKSAGRDRVNVADSAGGAEALEDSDRVAAELRDRVRKLGRDLFAFLREKASNPKELLVEETEKPSSAAQGKRAAYVEAIHYGYLRRFRQRAVDLFNELSEQGIRFNVERWEIDPPEIAREKSVRHIAEECLLIAARMEIDECAQGTEVW